MITAPADYQQYLYEIQLATLNSSYYTLTKDTVRVEDKEYYTRSQKKDLEGNLEFEVDGITPIYEYTSLPENESLPLQNNTYVYERVGYRPTQAILLPTDEKIYNVNLNTRKIEAPEFIGTLSEHHAETIYFKMARYFDNMDLSTLCCVIQYVNRPLSLAKQLEMKGNITVVPFYDLETFSETDEMLVPWCIDDIVTNMSGPITFSIRFYKISADGSHFIYNLNTVPVQSRVLDGINVVRDDNENLMVDGEFKPPAPGQVPTATERIWEALSELSRKQLYWLDV